MVWAAPARAAGDEKPYPVDPPHYGQRAPVTLGFVKGRYLYAITDAEDPAQPAKLRRQERDPLEVMVVRYDIKGTPHFEPPAYYPTCAGLRDSWFYRWRIAHGHYWGCGEPVGPGFRAARIARFPLEDLPLLDWSDGDILTRHNLKYPYPYFPGERMYLWGVAPTRGYAERFYKEEARRMKGF